MSTEAFSRCPKCNSSLDPKRSIGSISVCTGCHWAGSYQSYNANDWVQFKTSLLLIVFGLIVALGITRIPLDILEIPNSPASLQLVTSITQPPPPLAQLTLQVEKQVVKTKTEFKSIKKVRTAKSFTKRKNKKVKRTLRVADGRIHQALRKLESRAN